MQFFVPTLQGVSKMNIEGNHRTDTDLSVASNGLGQQHASARSWMQYLRDVRRTLARNSSLTLSLFSRAYLHFRQASTQEHADALWRRDHFR